MSTITLATCAIPTCSNTWERHSSQRGQPRVYCSRTCQLLARKLGLARRRGPRDAARPATHARGHQPPHLLHLSHDRKVSPRGTYQESRGRWIPSVPNSIGLVAGDSCPGKTPWCERVCYGVKSENNKGVRAAMERNFRMLAAADFQGMVVLLADAVIRYLREADRVGLAPEERIFRVHWDGDFFSETYARAWAAVMTMTPDVRYFAYTRSVAPYSPVDVVPILADVHNLALYLSIDEHNQHAARAAAGIYDLNLAACADEFEDAAALVPDSTPVPCPENAGRIPLMAAGVGACVSCRLCPDARRDILFHSEKSVAVRRRRRAA